MFEINLVVVFVVIDLKLMEKFIEFVIIVFINLEEVDVSFLCIW